MSHGIKIVPELEGFTTKADYIFRENITANTSIEKKDKKNYQTHS